jgi:hypothetical protein
MKLLMIVCSIALMTSASVTLAKSPQHHIFPQDQLRIPVGNDPAHQEQMDMCIKPNPEGKFLPDHCDEKGQRHAQNLFCHQKGYRHSVGPMVTQPINQPTMAIGDGSQCPNRGCKTFMQIECTK